MKDTYTTTQLYLFGGFDTARTYVSSTGCSKSTQTKLNVSSDATILPSRIKQELNLLFNSGAKLEISP